MIIYDKPRYIYKYPHTVLHNVNAPVSNDEFEELKDILTASLKKTTGVALAAPQIGINKQAFAYYAYGNDENKIHVVFNPSIDGYSENLVSSLEGCLSIKDFYWSVCRNAEVRVNFSTLYGHISEVFRGIEAKIFQHEMQHLSGSTIIDFLSDEQFAEFENRYFKANGSIKVQGTAAIMSGEVIISAEQVRAADHAILPVTGSE